MWRLLAGAALCCAPSVQAAETPAGTPIVNVARLSYATDAREAVAVSNEHRTIVAERLDVALSAGTVVSLSDGYIVVPATLTNTGNGREAFDVTATASAGDDRVVRIAVDADRDGRYDPSTDRPIDGRTPALEPEQNTLVFVVLRPGTTGTATLNTTAATGSGRPGTSFSGSGDGGGDAVTGPTEARAEIVAALPGEPTTTPTLLKSAVVRAPDGSSRAVRGATITYTLAARFVAAVDAAEVRDPVPSGTAYVPSSLTLDEAPLTDAADTDAGEARSGAIGVTLGAQPAGATRTIRFQVVIE